MGLANVGVSASRAWEHNGPVVCRSGPVSQQGDDGPAETDQTVFVCGWAVRKRFSYIFDYHDDDGIQSILYGRKSWKTMVNKNAISKVAFFSSLHTVFILVLKYDHRCRSVRMICLSSMITTTTKRMHQRD